MLRDWDHINLSTKDLDQAHDVSVWPVVMEKTTIFILEPEFAMGLRDIFPDRSIGNMFPYSSNRRENWVVRGKSQITHRRYDSKPSTLSILYQTPDNSMEREISEKSQLGWEHAEMGSCPSRWLAELFSIHLGWQSLLVKSWAPQAGRSHSLMS